MIAALAWVFAIWMLVVIFDKDIRKNRPRGLYSLYLMSLIAVLLHLLLYTITLSRGFRTDYDFIFFEYELIGGVMILSIVLAGWHRKVWAGLLTTAILFCLDYRAEILGKIAAPIFDPDYGQRTCVTTDPAYHPVAFVILTLALLVLTFLMAFNFKRRVTEPPSEDEADS